MRKEVMLLRDLDHPNIVKYYQTDLSTDMTSIDVLIEYVPGGSLKRIIQKYNKLEETIVRHYIKQLVYGLVYLHDHGVVHRDLKCANVLLSANGVIKLTDFGSSRRFDSDELELSKSVKGSPYWMAPEVVLKHGHSFSADIWSLGCVMIEMIAGRPPWSNLSRESKQVLKLIATPNNYPQFPECSDELKDLIRQCIQRDPAHRPNAKQLLEHRFLNHPTIYRQYSEINLDSVNPSVISSLRESYPRGTIDNIREIIQEMKKSETQKEIS